MIFLDAVVEPEYKPSEFFRRGNYTVLDAGSDGAVVAKSEEGSVRITYHEIATLAWNVYQNSGFFRYRYNIRTYYCADLNGSGTQGLTIGKLDQNVEYYGETSKEATPILFVVFDSSSVIAPSVYQSFDWIYEADASRDRRKDYEPSVQLGKKKFWAKSCDIHIGQDDVLAGWLNKNYLLWTSELIRLSKPRRTLSEWVTSGFDMGVTCGSLFCRSDAVTISNNDLGDHLSVGETLGSLENRLVCKKCRENSAVFFPK